MESASQNMSFWQCKRLEPFPNKYYFGKIIWAGSTHLWDIKINPAKPILSGPSSLKKALPLTFVWSSFVICAQDKPGVCHDHPDYTDYLG